MERDQVENILRQKLLLEESRYRLALQNDREFYYLKQIQNNIRSLQLRLANHQVRISNQFQYLSA